MTTTPAPFARILLPTDFSAFSARALRHALGLARRFNTRLKVVHVIQATYPVGEAMQAGAPWSVFEEARKAAGSDMDAFMAGAREAGIEYETEIREGSSWREILASAEEMPADLVVIGTHGRSGPERFFLGSVAEKLIHRLSCPVLTVRHEEGRVWETPSLVRRILCATDFSENSDRAFQLSLALAASLGAKVTLLHAIEHMPDLGAARFRMIVPDVEPLMKEIERAASERLGKTIDALKNGFVDVDVTARLGAGRAYKEILQGGDDEHADLIVIGAQGHGVIEHLLSGSNAQHVIRAANCAVLTVRPPKARVPAEDTRTVIAAIKCMAAAR